MRKLLVCTLVLALTAAYVLTAEEEGDGGLGLSVGLEFGIGNINNDDRDPYLMPTIVYDDSLFDGALDVYAELDYYFYLNEDLPMELYYDLFFGYNLGLGDTSTLSILLENENDYFFTRSSAESSGILTPGLLFTQSLSFGDLYVQADFPLEYIGDFGAGLDFTFGWQSAFGLGIELVEHNSLSPDAGYAGFDVIISYENDSIYCEIEIDTSDADSGITITPWFEYYFNAFTFYAWCEFDGIGIDGGLSITPAIGVKFSF